MSACTSQNPPCVGRKHLQWFPTALRIEFKFFTMRVLGLPDGPCNLTYCTSHHSVTLALFTGTPTSPLSKHSEFSPKNLCLSPFYKDASPRYTQSRGAPPLAIHTLFCILFTSLPDLALLAYLLSVSFNTISPGPKVVDSR